MKKRISCVLALILAATLVLSITGCGNKTNSNQSSEQQSNYHNPDIEAKDLLYDLEMIDFQGMVENKDVDPVYTDFAVKLAQASDQKDANLLVSPMSVMYGLMLPANGAKALPLACQTSSVRLGLALARAGGRLRGMPRAPRRHIHGRAQEA